MFLMHYSGGGGIKRVVCCIMPLLFYSACTNCADARRIPLADFTVRGADESN